MKTKDFVKSIKSWWKLWRRKSHHMHFEDGAAAQQGRRTQEDRAAAVPTRRIREWAIIGWATEEWQTKGGRRQAVHEDHAEVDARHAGASEADCGLQGWRPRRWSRSGEVCLRPSDVGRMESWDSTHRFWRLGDLSSPPHGRFEFYKWDVVGPDGVNRTCMVWPPTWSCRQSRGWQVLQSPPLNFSRRNGPGLRGELRHCFWALFQSHWGRSW